MQEWQTASNGKAKMPPVIDFNSADFEWYAFRTAGYSSPSYNGTLAIKKQSMDYVEWSIRHEMCHTNDLKLGKGIDLKYLEVDEDGSIIFGEYGSVKPKKTEKLRQELLNAGIPVYHIDYAFTSVEEFIAVASEGDMSKYSPEFKEMLIEFGMPEWMFSLKPKLLMKELL